MYDHKLRCTRCHEPLRQGREVWLEMNWKTGLYSADPIEPANESQGAFPFGAACAKTVLRKRGAIS